MPISCRRTDPSGSTSRRSCTRQLDELLPPDVIIASSSSGLTMSEIQLGCAASSGALRDRPSVQSTAPDTAGRDRRRSQDFRRDDPARIRILHVHWQGGRCVSTRRCRATSPTACRPRWRARSIISLPKVSSALADVDTALCWGPGLRWGIMGNMMLNHLGGGPGGIEHFFQQFTGPMTAWWKTLGSPVLTPEVQKKLIDSVHAEVGSRSIDGAGGGARRDSAWSPRTAHQASEGGRPPRSRS